MLSASLPGNLRRASTRLAGTPRRSPPITAAMPTCRLVMKPLTKLFWSKMCANQRSVYPRGGNVTSSLLKKLNQQTKMMGVRMRA